MKVSSTLFFAGLLNALAMAAPSPEVNAAPPSTHVIRNAPVDSAIANALGNMFLNGGLTVDENTGLPIPRTSPSASATNLFRRQAGDTRNDLINGRCDDVVIIFARGTSSPGNIGNGIGPAFINQVSAAEPGKVIAQGVLPYPADVWGYLAGGSAEGARSMAGLVQRTSTQCPAAKIVLSGYSQGAQVVHLAAALIPSTLHARIAAIVTFGDPKRDEAFPGTLNSKKLVICNDGDLICDGLPIILDPHGSPAYEARLPEVIPFVAARV